MRNKLIYLMATLILFFNGCTEKDLVLTPTRELANNFYAQDENIITAIWTTYSTLHAEHTPLWGNTHMLWGNIASDDAYAGGADGLDQEGYQRADTYKSTPLDPSSNLAVMMRQNFKAIYACNLLLDGLESKTPTNLSIQAIAEAKFVKGLCYFYMARMFGGLAILRKTANPSDKIPRSSYTATLNYIAEILQESVDSKLLDGKTSALPQKRWLGEYPNEGRASLASAQALLGKVYLYLQKYDDAKKVLLPITTSTAYKLENVFYNLFNPNQLSDEMLFQINYPKIIGNKRTLGLGELQLVGPRCVPDRNINDTIAVGWGFNQPTSSLVKAFEKENDMIRLHSTVMFSDSLQKQTFNYYEPDYKVILADSALDSAKYAKKYGTKIVRQVWTEKHTRVWTNNKDGYWDKKHLNNPKNIGGTWESSKFNHIILRLADVYLMLAEAYNQSGNDAEALNFLNKVRDRVLLPPISKSGAELFQAIKNERRLEMALEGERFFDLIRWGDADAVLGSLGYSDGTPGTKTKGFFPYPQSEIDATGFQQNEGY